jgi:hypothetical protein
MAESTTNERNCLAGFEGWTLDFCEPVVVKAGQITETIQKCSPFGTFLVEKMDLAGNDNLAADQICRDLVALEEGDTINLRR